MKQNIKLVLIYSLFAALSIVVNLATQEGAIRLLSISDIGNRCISLPLFTGPWNMLVGMVCGTLTGLVVKYILDKKFIFNFATQNFKQDGKAFCLYSIMGLATTAIFYITQLAFFHIFATRTAFYIGGAIGLSIGYWVKYLLDKRFVFNSARSNA